MSVTASTPILLRHLPYFESFAYRLYGSPLCNIGILPATAVRLNNQLTLGLVEYVGNSLDAYPAISQIQEGRLPEQALEIAFTVF